MNELVGFPHFLPLEAELHEGRDQAILHSGKTRVSGSLEEGHVTKTKAGGQET